MKLFKSKLDVIPLIVAIFLVGTTGIALFYYTTSSLTTTSKAALPCGGYPDMYGQCNGMCAAGKVCKETLGNCLCMPAIASPTPTPGVCGPTSARLCVGVKGGTIISNPPDGRPCQCINPGDNRCGCSTLDNSPTPTTPKCGRLNESAYFGCCSGLVPSSTSCSQKICPERICVLPPSSTPSNRPSPGITRVPIPPPTSTPMLRIVSTPTPVRIKTPIPTPIWTY